MFKHLRLGRLLWMFAFVLTFVTVGSKAGYGQLSEVLTFSAAGTPAITLGPGGIDNVTNTIDLRVPYYTDVTTLTDPRVTTFTVSPGASLHFIGTAQYGGLYTGLPAALVSGTSTIVYSTDDPSIAGNQFWLTVLGSANDMENYMVTVSNTPPTSTKTLSLTSITGLVDCYGDARTTAVSAPVANALGGADYTITLLTGPDGNKDLTFNYTVVTDVLPAPGVSPISGSTYNFGISATGPYIVTVTAQDLTTAQYRFYANWVTPSNIKTLATFDLLVPKVVGPGNFVAPGTLDNATKTYAVTVPYGTNVTNLAAQFTLTDQYAILTHSEDSKLRQVSGTTQNNYTDPVAFTVYDQGCGTLEYFVVVTVAPNAGNDISSLQFAGTVLETCDDSSMPYEGDFTLNGEPGSLVPPTMLTLTVPYGTDLSDFDLTPVIPVGATYAPVVTSAVDGVPFTITVTAANGISQKVYTVTINVGPPSTEAKILTFNFLAADNAGVIPANVTGDVDESTHRIDLVVPWGTDVTELVASFTSSPNSCVFINGPGITDQARQTTSVTVNDFTGPLTYTVVAQDGTTEGYYNVVVTFVPADTHNELTGLAISGQADCLTNSLTSEITGASPAYVVRLRNVRDAGIELTVSFTIPALATASHTSPVTWTPVGNTPLTITITSQSGDAVDYTITPNWVVPSTLKQITTFSFDPYVSPAGTGNMQLHMIHSGAIDQTAKTITVHVPYGTDVTGLKATFTLNDMYARLTHSEENLDLRVPQTSGLSPINYTTPAAFTVYDEACNTVEYFVTVIVDPNAGNDITGLTFAGLEYQNCESCEEGTPASGSVSFVGTDITVTVPFGTNLSDFDIAAEVSLGATVSPALTTITSATVDTWIPLTVTAADGVATKAYRIKFVRAAALSGTQLLTFGFEADNNSLTADAWTLTPIDHTTLRIDIELPYGVSLTNLISSFTHSPMACVFINGPDLTDKTLKCSGEGPGNNYTNAVTYTVVAQNGNEAYYNVYVKNTPPATDKWLNNFVVTGLPRCFSNLTYGLSETPAALGVVTRTGNAINISVKAGTVLTNLNVAFAIPATATVSPNPATTHDFSSPVAFTVTAQDGSTTVYTVTVTVRPVNGEKKILTYNFSVATSSTINEVAKTVDVWVPWATNLNGLVASFTLSSGAEMTHSEDIQVLQTSGVTPNDFTTPVAYTVWSESCSSVEYFVTVHITPDVNTGISQFTFSTTGCGCGLGTTIDSYARRIIVKLPNKNANGAAISLASLAPSVIGIANGATISPAVTAAQNWTNGPVKYTVTAPDGVTKADWMVSVVNPPCVDTDILSWNFVEGSSTASWQVGASVINTTDHTIWVTVKPNTSLKSLFASTTLSCGASICCNVEGCAGTAIDFSENMCHTCVVKAQDETVTQDWTICIKYQDVTLPVVTTWSVMAYNCLDSVAVKSNEAGYVFIVNASKITNLLPYYNLADMTGTTSVATSVAKMVADRMGAYAAIANANDTVFVKTNGLYSGIYYAFSVDKSGNISCISDQRLYLDICDVEVATLCDLRGQPMVYRYTLTGEVFVTYEETRTGGNLKYVQDATCGIKIVDKLNGLKVAYNVGTGLTNLRGLLDNSGVDLTFIPDCCYAPTQSSTGNVVAPINLTWDQFKADCYGSGSAKKYESMLVTITTPMIAFDDYDAIHPNWMFNAGHASDLATTNAMGGYEYYIQSVFNSSLIGTAIPTLPAYYTGIRTNVNWGSVYGLITPRKAADIVVLTAPVITANPNPASVEGVLPTTCKSIVVTIFNEGVGNSSITALYLDDNAAVDEFNIVNPPAVPFTLATWTSKQVTISFCPLNAGDETTNLIVEYGTGKTLVVPINGKTAIINAIPYCQNFNDPFPTGGMGSYNGWEPNPENGSRLSVYPSTAWFTFDTSVPMILRPREATAVARRPAYLFTPGFAITGADPVLSFVEATFTDFNTGANAANPNSGGVANSPLNIYVSTNGVTWTLLETVNTASMPVVDPSLSRNDPWRTRNISLSAFSGQSVWFKFEAGCVNNEYYYWGIDNMCIQDRITTPIIVGTPNPGAFGGVQVGATGTLAFSLKNAGISVLKIKKVEVVGTSFTLVDTNVYPMEVTDGPGTWAYTLGNAGSECAFSVDFKPTDIGVKTGKIVVTYGLYSDMTYEIALSGEGLSCYTAAVAEKGQNYAPSQNTWFKYTADKFSIVQVTSCDPHQDLVGTEYAWDTFLYVYSDCEGTLIGSHDDMEGACVYNRASSSVQTVVNAGETIYIFWPLSFPTALYAYDGFYFNINVTYPTDGDVCENAIPLTLPVVNHFGSTVEFNDDYNISPCSPFSNYMDGNDKVYTITTTEEGYLVGTILGAYGSIHVLDVCPKEELTKDHCKAFTGGPNGGTGFRKKIQAGTYFVIISTWAPPQTVDYLLNLSWESGSAVVDADLTSSMTVYPNPTNGKFSVSISNPEAMDMTLELVNISGQVVYRNEVKAAYSYNEDIDATTFAKGVYYLKVNNGKGVKVEKVVVQ